MNKISTFILCFAGMLLFALNSAAPFLVPAAFAHCDTLDGPVVKAAQTALEAGDVTPVLKWVKKENEAQIKDRFQKTLRVRNNGKEARELADMYFFETLVRLHRAGERAPYTGLKPAGVVELSVAEADRALESGSDAKLIKLITESSAKGIHERFIKAKETKKHADHSVDAGRRFVEAYVQFTHYVERLHLDARVSSEHHEGHSENPVEKNHQH